MESKEDIANFEAWAVLIADIFKRIPADKRAVVLALVTKNEEAAKQGREASGDKQPVLTSAEFVQGWEGSPRAYHWHTIMRLKSLMIQVFARDIANNHSGHDATELLFARHRHGAGSGLLEDYLGDRGKIAGGG
jgi:hypothetical protein